LGEKRTIQKILLAANRGQKGVNPTNTRRRRRPLDPALGYQQQR